MRFCYLGEHYSTCAGIFLNLFQDRRVVQFVISPTWKLDSCPKQQSYYRMVVQTILYFSIGIFVQKSRLASLSKQAPLLIHLFIYLFYLK